MTSSNYQHTITVSNTPKAAFKALTEGFEYWWTKPDQPISQQGDRAKFTFPPGKSFWTFEATVLIPNKRIEMQCIEALHLHEGQPKAIEQEWLGTKVVWDIHANGVYTDITIEHHGLVPNLHCYDICRAGWDFFFSESLQAYLDSGEGKPHSY